MSDRSFNLKEIIEMALQIERCGVAFYGRLKELAQSPEARRLYTALEEAEHRHISDFEAVLKSALEKHGNRQYAATEEELLYLRAFASRRIFRTPEEAVGKVDALCDPLEGIDMALDFELASVSFYQDMAKLIEDSRDRSSVEELERQERQHAARLYALREKTAPVKEC